MISQRLASSSSMKVAGYCFVSVSLLVLPVVVVDCLAVKPLSSSVRHATSRSSGSLVVPRMANDDNNNKNNRAKYNPFSTLIGDMASSLLGSASSSSAKNPKIDEALTSLTTMSSWQHVQDTLKSLQTPQEQAFRDNLSKGCGDGSPLHTLRLYDESNKEQDVRVTLFRDSSAWCPYSQKVWAMLEEKRIPYRVEKINMRCYGEKPASFLQIQPSGNIPVAIIDGVTYGQSNDIMYAMEQLFPNHKSLAAPKGQELQAQQLLRLERQIFSAWMYWLTGDSRDGKRHQQAFVDTLQQVEAALGNNSDDGPFFMGKDITIVDLMYVPFLERMCASLAFFKGFIMRVPPNTPTEYPNLNKWFDAMEKLDSYQLTKSDYYTHCWDLPPQLGGCTYEDAGLPYERAINGERSLLDESRGSWELPLEPHNGGIEPDWDWAMSSDDGNADKREAVERLSFNHDNIVKFAARGAGRKGMPPYSAQLADPNAVPNEAVLTGVDVVLRTTSMAMLEGIEKHNNGMEDIAQVVTKQGGKDYADGIIASLSYLRDRIGVPRDMKLPAARQLRAHLNWAIGKILSAQDAS